MDGQDYLNQISAANRPIKRPFWGGSLGSKLLVIGGIGLAVLIFVIIIGAILGGKKGSEKDLSIALKLHLDNTSAVISDYQPNLKSSDLRSISASLYSILSNTDRELTDYLAEKYGYKNADKKAEEKATAAKEELGDELFEAKINGVLDRTYAHKMTYEISLLMAEETKLINMTRNDSYREILNKSYNSLDNLYNNFNNFSEAK